MFVVPSRASFYMLYILVSPDVFVMYLSEYYYYFFLSATATNEVAIQLAEPQTSGEAILCQGMRG